MKNKMRFIWIVLLVIFARSFTVFSQTDTTAKKKQKFIIKYAPLSILDPNLTTLQFGFEYFLNKKNTIQLEIGKKIPFTDSSKWRSSFIGGNGFRVKVESHFYFSSSGCSLINFPFSGLEPVFGEFKNKYLGIELFYWENNYATQDELLDTLLNEPVFVTYKVNKQTLGASLKWGFLMNLSRHLDLELYGGLGIKYFFISNPDRNINRPNCVLPERFYEWVGPSSYPDLEKYAGFRVNFRIGFRVCYKINFQ